MSVIILIISIILHLLLGWVSSAVVRDSFKNKQYLSLKKASFQPPGFIFGIVWTALYAMLGIVFYYILTLKGIPYHTRIVLLTLYIGQMLMNYIWTPITAGLNKWRVGFIMILAMLVMSVTVAFILFKYSKMAGGLMIVYCAWLAFASILNYYIISHNKPG